MPDNGKMYPWYLQQAGYYTSNNSKTDYNVITAKAGTILLLMQFGVIENRAAVFARAEHCHYSRK